VWRLTGRLTRDQLRVSASGVGPLEVSSGAVRAGAGVDVGVAEGAVGGGGGGAAGATRDGAGLACATGGCGGGAAWSEGGASVGF
jgi:hypothetical protein